MRVPSAHPGQGYAAKRSCYASDLMHEFIGESGKAKIYLGVEICEKER